jgi:hypothetical protein
MIIISSSTCSLFAFIL